MDEKTVLNGRLPKFTVQRFKEYEKQDRLLLEEMLKEFAAEYGQDLFQSLRIDLDAKIQEKIIDKLQGTEFIKQFPATTSG